MEDAVDLLNIYVQLIHLHVSGRSLTCLNLKISGVGTCLSISSSISTGSFCVRSVIVSSGVQRLRWAVVVGQEIDP